MTKNAVKDFILFWIPACHGVSTYTKNVGWPVRTDILHVDFQANYRYNVSWMPFEENTIKGNELRMLSYGH